MSWNIPSPNPEARSPAPATIAAAAPAPTPATPPAVDPPVPVAVAAVAVVAVVVVAVVAVVVAAVFIPSFVSIVPAVFFPNILITNLLNALPTPCLKILIKFLAQPSIPPLNSLLKAIIANVRLNCKLSAVLRTLVILSNVLTPFSPKTFSIAPRVHSNALYPQ